MKFIIYFLLFFCLFLPVCATSIDNEINEIFDLDEVIYIEEILPMNPQNDLINSKSPINVNFLYSTPYDLFGEGIIIFQYEDGVPDYTHLDLIGRVDWFGDDITDHATHIAGIMIGNGSLNSTIVGIAPKANIRADEVSGFNYNETGGIFGIEYDYDYAINFEDIDFASNSWGYPVKDLINSTNTEQLCSYYGDYESNAVLFDNIVYGNLTEIRVSKIPTIVFSVGNEREVWGINPCNTMNGNFNNMYPYYTISPPRVAKNIITVGAVESITNSIGYFSAFGPTDDGRIKPELVAPGLTNESLGIISTVSNNSYSYFLPDENNEDAYGTSMAAPHVSGTIALMLEQWNRQYSTDPLPSTIKALLLDSTTDLHRNGNGTKIIDGPDYKNGYGLLNAKEAVDRIINQTFIEDNISDDQIKVYAININNQNELKVTLAWDDLPGNPALSSEGVLVNDLNLKLISPNGITFYPWVLDPSQPQNEATKGEDHKNNVEQVYINNPINGEWLVLIDENNIDVSVNEQKFSLVSKNQIKPYNFQTEEKIITLNTENYWKNLNWKFDKTNYYATINSGSLLNNYLYYDEPLLKFQDTIFIKASSGSITVHHFLFGLEFNQTQNIDTWKNNYGHYMRYAIQFDPNTDKIRVSEFNNPQTGTTQFTAFPDVIFIPNQEYDFKIEVDSVKGAKYYYKISINPILIDDINWSLLYDSTSSGNNNGVLRGTDSLKFWASGRNIDSSNQINYIKFEANS